MNSAVTRKFVQASSVGRFAGNRGWEVKVTIFEQRPRRSSVAYSTQIGASGGGQNEEGARCESLAATEQIRAMKSGLSNSKRFKIR